MVSFLQGATPVVWYLICPPSPGCQSCQGPIIQFFGTKAFPVGIVCEVNVVGCPAEKEIQPLDPT